MTRTVLITGASGFVGTEVVKVLRRDMAFRVITTDCRGEADYIGDLTAPNFVNTLPNVDIIIHCAAVQYLSARDLASPERRDVMFASHRRP